MFLFEGGRVLLILYNIYIYIYYVVLKSRMPERCFRPLFQNVVSELCLALLNVVLTLFLGKLEVSNVVLNVVFERCF